MADKGVRHEAFELLADFHPKNTRAKLEAENKRLREALDQSAQWFFEYANMHADKSNYEKALANREKAFYCRAALGKDSI
jgi:hypothetical protein